MLAQTLFTFEAPSVGQKNHLPNHYIKPAAERPCPRLVQATERENLISRLKQLKQPINVQFLIVTLYTCSTISFKGGVYI